MPTVTPAPLSTGVDQDKSETEAGGSAPASYLKDDKSDKIEVHDDTDDHEADNDKVGGPTDANARLGEVFKAAEPVRDIKVDIIPAKAMEGVRVTPLTAEELKQQLLECETTITRGLVTFVEVGTALAKIRDNELFLPQYGNFEAYLDVRWEFTKQRASQLILAADTHQTLAGRLDSKFLPTNERGMRELLKAPKDKHAAILALAAKDGEPTTESIAKARATVVPKKAAAKAPKPKPLITIEAAIKAVSRWADYLESCDAKALTDDQRTELATAQAKAVKFYKKFNLAA